MSFMSVIGHCAVCRKLFSFNAELVPSTPVNGVREPICKECVEWANPLRVAKGLAPIVPLPGAYDPEEYPW